MVAITYVSREHAYNGTRQPGIVQCECDFIDVKARVQRLVNFEMLKFIFGD